VSAASPNGRGPLGDGGPRRGEVALVLPGGGVRGAYEAGALAVLLPALADRGERVSVFCGTSVGAINAAALASVAHLPVEAQVDALLEHWGRVEQRTVLRRILGPRAPLRLARLAGELAGVPGLRAGGLLEPALERSMEGWIDWGALHDNVEAGHARSVCILATALSDGASVAFLERHRRGPLDGLSEEIRYLDATLDGEHVRASAAIPFLFPPVEVRSPQRAAGFYVDGGTRLNAPIKPAIDLGADRIIAIGFEPLVAPPEEPVPGRAPRLTDVAVNVLDGLISDQVGADMHRLAAVNSFFAGGYAHAPSASGLAYRESRGRRPYRRIHYAFVAPGERGELGRLAERTFRERLGGLRALRDPEAALLGGLLGGGERGRGELLSYLFFDPAFVRRLIAAGRRDAGRWLARHPDFWCADSAHDFDLDPGRATRAAELARLDEWRTLRRR
jgi:NTE family protein